MFGFIMPNIPALSQEEERRYRACYCGLCRSLRLHRGGLSRVALNYDMSFLALVLSSVYEDEGFWGVERCVMHPAKKHEYWHGAFTDYAADMNLLLAYYKCMDDWRDDKNPAALAGSRVLSGRFKEISELYPRQREAVEENLAALREAELSENPSSDICADCFGKLLGAVFECGGGIWREKLRDFGESLGRFIYMLDACVDFQDDIKHKRFNPLNSLPGLDGCNEASQNLLKMLASDSADRFESLPVVQDLSLLRNILYSGVWTKYYMKQKKD